MDVVSDISGLCLQAKWSWLQKAHQAEIDYMQSTPFSLSIPSHGCIVVHAGMLPGVELEKQDLFDLIEVRQAISHSVIFGRLDLEELKVWCLIQSPVHYQGHQVTVSSSCI